MNEGPLRAPALARWLFERSLHEVHMEEVLGDLEEIYARKHERAGAKRAHSWYWSQFVRSLPLFLLATGYWSLVMLKSYLKTTFRTFRRHKGYTLLNITGLSVGIALSLLALLYVEHELSYDRFHSKADRIYRVVQETRSPGITTFSARTSFKHADGLLETFPEVMKATGIIPEGEYTLQYGDKRFRERARFKVDPSFLDIFDIEFVRGDRKTALENPNAIVITEELARKYFGEEDPIGKTVTMSTDSNKEGYYYEQTVLLTVTAVVRSMPVHSHFHFDALQRRQRKDGEYQWNVLLTYVLLPEDYPPERLEEKFPAFVDTWNWGWWEKEADRYWEELVRSGQAHWRLRLQPLTDIHLDAQYTLRQLARRGGLEPPGSQTTIKLLSLIAFFILILACINFMNLATARSAKRRTEVGIRKVVGSSRAQLVRQFLVESTVLSLLALLVAAVLVALALPAFNGLLGTDITVGLFQHAYVVPGMIVVALTVGIVAGSYPAFFLSSFRPVALLRGTCQAGMRGVSLRNGLVVFQLLISILLIVATAVVYKQLSFMRQKDLGFSGEQVLVLENVSAAFWRAEAPSYSRIVQEHGHSLQEWVDMTPEERDERIAASGGTLVDYKEWLWRRIKTLKEQLLQMPGVLRVSHSGMVPGRAGMWITQDNRGIDIAIVQGDVDLFETLQLEVLAGRITDEDEQAHRLVINEAATKLLGTDHVIGQSFLDLLNAASEGQQMDNRVRGAVEAPIVAVVKDFHFADLHTEIQPTVFWLANTQPPPPKNVPATHYWWPPPHLMARISTGDIEATLASMEQTWKQFIADEPLPYLFLDDDFGKLFQAEVRLGKTFGFFAALAIFIACLGLFGLAAFMAEQRTKEIGIRKVLGASARDIVRLLSKNFLWLLLLGNLVAWPIGYFVMQRWLEDFAYRIDIGVSVFFVTGAVTLVLVLISVGGQALRASLANPVESLRYE